MNIAEDDLVVRRGLGGRAAGRCRGDERRGRAGRRRPAAPADAESPAAAGVASPVADGPLLARASAAAHHAPAGRPRSRAGRAGGSRARRPRRTSPPRAGRIPRMPGGSRFWWILLALLAVNWFIVSAHPRPREPARRPYTAFREQVEAGNVSEVTSRGDTIQGTFKKEVTYPAGSDTKDTRLRDRAAGLRRRRAPAAADRRRTSWSTPSRSTRAARCCTTLLLSFGPVILLVLLFVFLARRAGGAGGALSSLGRSKAKRYDASASRGSRSTTSPASTRPRTSSSRSSTS